MTTTLILITCLVGLIMSAMHIHHRRRIKNQRAGMFAHCKTLFSEAKVTQDDVNFPVLEGHYQGFPIKLEPIADHVGFRKLPSLWLLITVKAPQPYKGVFDFLVRPQNIEFFSPSEHLEHQLEVPGNWPQYATLKTDNPANMPPVERLDKHMDLFDDNKTKELLITAKGIRIVYQANQANQNTYRTLRSLSFEDLTIKRERLQELLDKAIAIHQDLSEQKRTNNETSEHDHEHTAHLSAAC